MRFPVPKSLTGQLALLVIAAFVGAQVISLWLFADERGAAVRAAQQAELLERSAVVLDAIEAAPEDSRTGILAVANSRLVRFSTDPAPLVTRGNAPALAGQLTQLVGTDRTLQVEEVTLSPHGARRSDPPAALVWLRDRMVAAGIAPEELRISIALTGGQWLNTRAEFQRPDIQLPPAILGTTFLSLLLILAALWFGLRRITDPLRRLASAADGFGLDAAPPEMPRDGPREVQALSEALERMQARLSAMIADRTRMLAALGHDLRSPITALRLRAEMVDEDETRERMIAALDEMQEMVEATLAYARGVSPDQPLESADLSELLADLVQDLSEQGPEVRLTQAPPLRAEIKRTPMRRALRNLIENAQRYGGATRVALHPMGKAAEIVIEDDGPGIPLEDLERVFDPFTRLEASRSRETGGTGLGLSIARAILRAHGGDVTLENRAEGGLRARVRLSLETA